MSDETQQAPAAEEAQQQQPEQPQETERTVPLTALEAERAKRQESEAKLRMYEEYIAKGQQQKPKEDEDDIVTLKDLKRMQGQWKREAIEEAFCSSNPDAVAQIEKDLPTVLQQKPWLRAAIESAGNRWQAAWDVVRTFRSEPERRPSPTALENARKLEQNMQKPGVASKNTSAPSSKLDTINSMIGTKDFRAWSEKVMRGEIKL